MSSLHLYQRPAEGELYVMSLAGLARRWRRKIRAVGGFWSGSFEIPEFAGLSWFGLQDFYNNRLGCRLVERTLGLTSWEGLIYEMRLVRGGQEYRRTLDPDWWHNKVKTMYSYPSSSDSEQGNLTYNPAANSFQDDGQDFSDWQTLAGDAVYSISVTNSDGTIGWGFLGVDFTTANPNDSINVYTDVELGTAGWNGEIAAKVPSTYEVRNVVLAGSRQDTGFSEDTDSSEIYGVMEYVLSLGGAVPEGATALRDRELSEFAWPRSRKMGGGQEGTGVRNTETVLEVSVAGFWVTLNWLYRTVSRVAAASDMIETLVSSSEFVTTRRIEINELGVKVDCDPIPQRRGDLCEDVILQGDIDGNQWQGGVYNGREFVYEQSPTTSAFFLQSDGTLADISGRPVVFQLFKPGVLIKDSRAPVGGQPAGGTERDDPRIGHIEEVEWQADRNELRYRVQGQEESVAVLREQLQSGSFVESEF
jgi:hypothetical protein